MQRQYVGIAFPPQRTEAGFFATTTEEALISGNIYTLLRTRKGEMIGVPDFGNSANDLLFEPMNNTTQSLLVEAITKDIKKWEPRVNIDSIKVVIANNAYNIEITLRIKSTNTTFKYTDALESKDR